MKNFKQQAIIFGLVSCLCLLVAPTLASAEAGDGVRSEAFKLDLSATAGTSVNSNLFYQEDVSVPAALALVITPGLDLYSVQKDRVDFTLRSGLSWTQFLGDVEAVRKQSGLSLNVDSALHFNQAGALSFRIEEDLQRTNEPPNGPSVNAINRFNNRLGGIVGIHPGGRALQGYLSYHWSSINFNNRDINLSQSNRDEHALQGRFVWQFRPRTAALLTANYTLINYDQEARNVSGNAFANNNSRPLRLTAGLNGLVLSNLSAELSAGYGRARYVSGPTFSGVIGRAGLGYFFGPTRKSKLAVAFDRSFADSIIGNFTVSNLTSLRLTHPLMDNRMRFNVNAFYDRRNNVQPDGGGFDQFGVEAGTATIPSEILDNRIGAGAGLDYAALKWLSLSAGYRANANITDDNVIFTAVSSGTTELAGRSYLQHIVNVSVTATY